MPLNTYYSFINNLNLNIKGKGGGLIRLLANCLQYTKLFIKGFSLIKAALLGHIY